MYVPEKVWKRLGGANEATVGVTLSAAGKWAWVSGTLSWILYCADFKKRVTQGWWKKGLALVVPVLSFISAIVFLSEPFCWVVPLIALAVSAFIIIFLK